MTARKITTGPLKTATARGKIRGRAFAYARGLLIDPVALGIGRPPFSYIDTETVAQRAWEDGYVAAMQDLSEGGDT